MRRFVVAAAAGLAMAATMAWPGGVATAAQSALKVTPGSRWTVEFPPSVAGCEVATFASNGTFTTDFGDSGSWAFGGRNFTMLWTSGPVSPEAFTGTFTKTPVKQYVGTFYFAPIQGAGQVVKGIVPVYQGFSC